MYFIELNGFGWNLLTASFICISAITTWQYVTFTEQAQKIWKCRSAEAISITQNIFRTFLCIASIWYGLLTQNLTITYTGGLVIPGLFIIRGLWKFGSPTKRDKLILVSCIIGVLLYLTPIDPALVFSGFMVVGLLPIIDQAYVLFKSKVRGVNHGGMLLTFVVKNAVLTIFAFEAGEKVYMVFIPLYFIVTLWQFLLWLSYGKETETKVPSLTTAD